MESNGNKIVIGGGNKLKGLPPTATNHMGLQRNRAVRSKAGMGFPKQPYFISSYFSPTEPNPIFAPVNEWHHVVIIPSGSGQLRHGQDVTLQLSPQVPVPWAFPYGKMTNEVGILGFNSKKAPFASPFYAMFAQNGDLDPNPAAHPTPDSTIVPQSYFSQKGRYIKSKTLVQMNANHDSWTGLLSISITWIAGNNTNGADRPDMFRFNQGSVNQTGLPIDGADGDFRRRENLYVQFYDENHQLVGNRVDLWKTKPDLTPERLQETMNDPNTSPWSNPWPTNLYPNGDFTTTVLTSSDFGNLQNASYFEIRQPAHTYYGDNYGVKFVELKFAP